MKMNSATNPRGAGRKPLKAEERRKKVSFRLNPETVEIVRNSGGTRFVEAAILEKREREK